MSKRTAIYFVSLFAAAFISMILSMGAFDLKTGMGGFAWVSLVAGVGAVVVSQTGAYDTVIKRLTSGIAIAPGILALINFWMH